MFVVLCVAYELNHYRYKYFVRFQLFSQKLCQVDASWSGYFLHSAVMRHPMFSDARSLTTTNSNSFIMTERHIVTIVYSKILQNSNEKSLTFSPSIVGHWVLALKTSLSFGDGNSFKIRKNRSFPVNKMRFDIIVYMCQTKQLVVFSSSYSTFLAFQKLYL